MKNHFYQSQSYFRPVVEFFPVEISIDCLGAFIGYYGFAGKTASYKSNIFFHWLGSGLAIQILSKKCVSGNLEC